MEEDCNLVFTTSRGHVKIAPTVPPHLKEGEEDIFKGWPKGEECRKLTQKERVHERSARKRCVPALTDYLNMTF